MNLSLAEHESYGNLKERGYLEGLGVDGRVILKWFLKKSDWRCRLK